MEQTLITRINEGQSAGLPDLSGPWEHVGDVEDWRVYIVHDPCHDRVEESYVDDRNTVIALHSERGIWRILGRELNRDLALDIASGRR